MSRDSVYLENLSIMLMEILKENENLKKENQSLLQELSKVQSIFSRERAQLKINLTAEISKHLLDASDNILRIINASKTCDDMNTIIEGIVMTGNELTKVLSSLDIQKQNPLGKYYDPNYYELGGVRDLENLDDNMILEVIRDGYTLQDKVIRPALVIVNSRKKN
jgi:molecular chaperone GrpE